ncbi:MAG: hypothetical protein KR126chlam3_00450 [Chlamydiae bacterium]|nr:hypothetical protein [Chlamydiota bacterium]
MINRIFIILFFAFSSLYFSTVFPKNRVEHVSKTYCCPKLMEAFSLIRDMPQVNDLLSKILEDGPLYIRSNHHFTKKFEGYWSGNDRTIYVTKIHSKAVQINTILFEMHNAINDSELEHLDCLAYYGKINRADYIRAVEYWEYKNAKATAAILNEGIEAAIFPEECYWYLSDDFEEHFHYQQSAGHSAYIGKMYDSVVGM